ncbi:hypothetical protein Hanom_Chr09g00825131 [Helianthus anomalus]
MKETKGTLFLLLFFLSFTIDSTMSWFNLNYVFGESSGNNTNTFISERNVVALPSIDYGYGCPSYTTYGQENYGNNFFVSGVYPTQQDIGEPSYAHESLVDEQHTQIDVGGRSYAQESLGDEQPAYLKVSYKIDHV